MPKSRNIVVARKPRPSRKPLPKREPPACGSVVRVVRGKAVERKPEDAGADERARGGLERMIEDARRAARGE